MGIKDQLDQAGVVLVAIGSGTPKQAQNFANKFKFEGELYVNQDLAAYKAFHLERGFWRTLGPRSLWSGVKTMLKGYYQGLNAGDLWQQGGVFVIGPGKQVIFEHRNIHAGDHVNLQKMMEAISRVKNEEAAAAAAAKTEETVVPKEEVVAAPAVIDNSLAPVNNEQDVRNFLSKWSESWQSGDMEYYRSCYTSDFNSNGKNLDAWISHKTDIKNKSKNIKISIDDLQILIEEKTAHVVFIQHYSSSLLKDSGKKILKLKKINNEWKIDKEIKY